MGLLRRKDRGQHVEQHKVLRNYAEAVADHKAAVTRLHAAVVRLESITTEEHEATEAERDRWDGIDRRSGDRDDDRRVDDA